jgi:acylglycerol lipase
MDVINKNLSFSFEEITNSLTDLKIESKQFESIDKFKIGFYQFAPSEPIAKLIFIHGGGAHSKLGYFHLAETLQNNYAVETFLMDIRGHGISEGKRGDSPNKESIFYDLNNLIELVKKDNNLPIYLGGHSSGGGLILNYNSWVKRQKVSGYFFISPELGYKSKTDKKDRIPFTNVKLGKFILNAISGGRLKQHDYAVTFNYPDEVLNSQPLIVKAITVNMSKVLTPSNPQNQFQSITEPIGLFIGENDELFNVEKVVEFSNFPLQKNNKSTTRIITNQNHLSILLGIGNEIGETIEKWQK